MEKTNQEINPEWKNKTFYEIFELEKTATTQEIKKSFRRLALIYHPDKNKNVNAEQDFRYINHIFSVLSDAEKRAIYDETGFYNEDESTSSSSSMNFKKVTKQEIDEYEKTYFGSDDEVEDLLYAHKRCHGDWLLMIEYIPFANIESIDRFKKLYDNIQKGVYQINKERNERKERKERKDESKDLLIMNIREKNKKQHMEMVKKMEEKYMGHLNEKQKKKKRKAYEDISEEDFLKAQKKMLSKKK